MKTVIKKIYSRPYAKKKINYYMNIVGLWWISIFCYLSVRQASHNQHENHMLLLHISGKFLSSFIAFGFRLIFTIFCKISCIYRFPELNNLVFTCRTIKQNKQKPQSVRQIILYRSSHRRR